MRGNVEADGEQYQFLEKNNSKNSIGFDNNFIDESLTFSVSRDEENRLENYFEKDRRIRVFSKVF